MDAGANFVNRTTSNGLGSDTVQGVYVVGSTVYVATTGGLSISTDAGANFVNRTTSNGLGDNNVRGVYVVGSTVYAATTGGLSISMDAGANFVNRTTSNGLGSMTGEGVYAVGSNVYAATLGGLSISTDGGSTFVNMTTADGLGSNFVYGVHAVGSRVYAATAAGLSIFLPVPTQMAINAGNNQSATVGTAVATAPSVLVRDASNNPVSGVTVTFTVSSGGGSVSSASATTNASGIASVTWTLGTSLGQNTMTASVSGLSGSPLTFTATAIAGPPATSTKLGTDGITALVTTPAIPPPAVRVLDAYNNPVSGASVSFDVSSGDGQLGPAVIANLSNTYGGGSTFDKGNRKAYLFTTGSSPIRVQSTTLLLNKEGSVTEGHLRLSLNSVTNNVIGAPLASVDAKVDLSVSNTWVLLAFDAPLVLQSSTQYALVVEELADQRSFRWVNGPTSPSAFNGVRYNQSLVFDGLVWIAPNTDRNLFVLAAEGLDSNSITVTTSATGLAALGTWKLGSTPGDNLVTVSDATGTKNFTATAITGTVTRVAGNNQTAIAGAVVVTPPSVVVRDANDKPVPGASVSFDLATVLGTTSLGVATTNSSGVATLSTWTLADVVGTQTLTASLTGSNPSLSASFTATAIFDPQLLTALNAVQASAAALTATSYTPASWSALTDALALVVISNAQLQAKITAITTAIAELITTQLQAELDELLAAAAALQQSDYTAESWSAQQPALTSALALPSATKTQVLAKIAALTAALDGLITNIARQALDAALTAVAQLRQADYTLASWSAHLAPLQQALALPESSTALMQAKADAINAILASLITVSAQKALDELLTRIATLAQDEYTPGSWSVLQHALALPISTNAQVLVKIEALNRALQRLTFKTPSSITISAGNEQRAILGTVLPVSPTVLVSDVNGNPIPDVGVVFTPVSNGSTITADTARTNQEGLARVGSWKLGPVAGQNQLRARVIGFDLDLHTSFTATGLVGDGSHQVAYVQVINNATMGQVSIKVEQALLADQLAYKSARPFTGVAAGVPLSWQLLSASASPTLTAPAPLQANHNYLVFAQGGADGKPLQLTMIDYAGRVNTTDPGLRLVFSHGVTNAETLRVEQVTASTPRVSLGVLANLAYAQVSAPVMLARPGPTTLQLSSQGRLLGQYVFDFTGMQGRSLTLVATGRADDPGPNKLMLLAFTPDAQVIIPQVTTSEQVEAELPDQFTLHQSYPNPFNPTTNIRFDLPEQARVSIQVVDVLGRQVMTIAPQTMSAGSNRIITLDASRLSSGTYFYRVVAEGSKESFMATGKLSLVK